MVWLHFQIIAPDGENGPFWARKGFTALNCMFVAGSSYKIYYLKSGAPGSAHDNRVFRESDLHFLLDEKIFVPASNALLLADYAYEVIISCTQCLKIPPKVAFNIPLL